MSVQTQHPRGWWQSFRPSLQRAPRQHSLQRSPRPGEACAASLWALPPLPRRSPQTSHSRGWWPGAHLRLGSPDLVRDPAAKSSTLPQWRPSRHHRTDARSSHVARAVARLHTWKAATLQCKAIACTHEHESGKSGSEAPQRQHSDGILPNLWRLMGMGVVFSGLSPTRARRQPASGQRLPRRGKSANAR